jgi:hypothetical protein
VGTKSTLVGPSVDVEESVNVGEGMAVADAVNVADGVEVGVSVGQGVAVGTLVACCCMAIRVESSSGVLLGDTVGAAVDCAVSAQALNAMATKSRLTHVHKVRFATMQ